MKERMSPPRVEPVRKSVDVSWSPQVAFERFTDGIATWWPLRTHSVGAERAETVVFEARVGGSIYEVIAGGERSLWGTVTECEAPRRVAFTWHPGREPDSSQIVEVNFDERDDGGTTVVLVHSGWETLGEQAQEMRDEYDKGWEPVLARFSG